MRRPYVKYCARATSFYSYVKIFAHFSASWQLQSAATRRCPEYSGAFAEFNYCCNFSDDGFIQLLLCTNLQTLVDRLHKLSDTINAIKQQCQIRSQKENGRGVKLGSWQLVTTDALHLQAYVISNSSSRIACCCAVYWNIYWVSQKMEITPLKSIRCQKLKKLPILQHLCWIFQTAQLY